jgi:hypothetical protein
MQIELKNIKHVESMSEETDCFSAVVYMDGVKSIEVENRGKGGAHRVHNLIPGAYDQLDAYCKTLPPVPSGYGGVPLDMDAELHISQLVEAWLQAKADKQHKLRLSKAFVTKIVYTRSDKPGIWEVKLKTGKVTPELLVKFRSARPEVVSVLNSMNIDEAVELEKAKIQAKKNCDMTKRRQITVRGLNLMFEADQMTEGAKHVQALQAVELINRQLRYGEASVMGAQLSYSREELEVNVDEHDD